MQQASWFLTADSLDYSTGVLEISHLLGVMAPVMDQECWRSGLAIPTHSLASGYTVIEDTFLGPQQL